MTVVLAVVAAVAIVFYLVTLVIWSPVTQNHARLLKELHDATEHHRQIAAREQVDEDVDEVLKLLSKLDEQLEQQAETSTIMTQLAEIAVVNGLTILGQTLDESLQDPDFKVLRQEVSFQGPYESLRQFLIASAALPGVTRVEAVSIERSTGAGEAVRGRLSLINYRNLVTPK